MQQRYPGDFFATAAGRSWLFGLLYLSEGAPMGFIWWALPAILTSRGLDLATVTALSSLLTLPWVFKFLAGPVIDFSLRRGHTLRRWITICQLCMGLALIPLAFIDWTAQYEILVGALFVHACCAATQDVAIDTLAIHTVPPEELGKINGWMQTGMLAGRACVAAAAVALAAAGYDGLVIAALILFVWVPLVVLLIARPDEKGADSASERHAFSLRALLGWQLAVGLWIALTAGAGFEFFTVTAGPLLQDLGGTAADTAFLFGVIAPAGLASGALAGGSFAGRVGGHVATGAGIGAVAFAVGTFVALRISGNEFGPYAWMGFLAIIYFASGFLICASYTLFMSLSRGEFAATRFSLFMSATNGCEAWAAYVGGRLAGPAGYSGALLALIGASALALPALLLSRNYRVRKDAKEED